MAGVSPGKTPMKIASFMMRRMIPLRALTAASANQDWRDWGSKPVTSSGNVTSLMRASGMRLARLQFMVETGRDVSAGLMPNTIMFITEKKWKERFGADFATWLAKRLGGARPKRA